MFNYETDIMTDTVQKIKEWISKTQDGLMDANGNFENPSEEGAFHTLSNLDYYIDSLQEEPVSEELHKVSKEWLRPQLDKSYANYGEGKMMELTHFDGYAMLDAIEFGAKWQKEKEYTCYEEAFEDGAKWKKEQIIKRLCNHANIDQMIEKFEDKYKPTKALDTEYYKRGIFDTIKTIKED